MKIKKRKYNKLTIIFTVVISILLLLAVVYVFINSRDEGSSLREKEDNQPILKTEDRPVGEVDYSKPSSDQENPALDELNANNNGDGQKENSNPIPVTITYADGKPLDVRILIAETIQGGSCILTLEKSDSDIIEQTVETFPTSNSSTCQGFTVDTSSVTPGNWKLTVKVKYGDRSGIATKEINL